MIDVYIIDMSGQLIGQMKPASVPRTEKLEETSVYHVILVVVVGYKGSGGLVEGVFMVGIKVTEMAPAIFVNYFSLNKERLRAFNGLLK